MWEQPRPLETDTVSVPLFMVPWKPNAGLIINIFSLSCLKACMGVQLWSVICSYIWNENEERGQPFWRFNSERLASRDNLMCTSNLEGCSAQWAVRAPFPHTHYFIALHLTGLHRCCILFLFCFLVVYKLKICGKSALGKSIGVIFATTIAHFASLCHSSVILTFHTFHYFIVVICVHWSFMLLLPSFWCTMNLACIRCWS